MAIDKAALLAARPGDDTRDVELPTLGGSVRVRALTRKEVHRVRGVELSEEQMEVRLLATAMVEPSMTEDEIEQWQTVAPAGELAPVANAVLELSGLRKAAVKDAMRTFRD